MMVRPLNLEESMQKPSPHYPLLAFVDVFCLLLAFSLFGSSFVTTPSLSIDLELPVAGSEDDFALWGNPWHDEVISVAWPGQVFFRGESLSIHNVENAVREFVGSRTDVVLLLRLDLNLPLEQQMEIIDQLRQAGVARVQMAVQHRPSAGFEALFMDRIPPRRGGELFP